MTATHANRSRWIAKSSGLGLGLTIQAEQMGCCKQLADHTENCWFIGQELRWARTPTSLRQLRVFQYPSLSNSSR
jgi:hypothetical protein